MVYTYPLQSHSEKAMRRRATWNAIFLGGAVLALLLLAAGLSGVTLGPGRAYTLANGRIVVQAPDGAALESAPVQAFAYLLMIVCFAAIVLYLLFSMLSELAQARLRPRLLTRIAALLPLFVLVAMLINLWRNLGPGEEPMPAPLPVAPTGEPFPTFAASPPWWLALVVGAILAALLAAGAWFFWRRSREPERPLAALAQAALADIRAGGDLRDTVLRCYRDMSQVLRERRGLEREQAMTPREFAEYLAAEGLRDEHIQRLTRLFERVRYGGTSADERDSREAVECLGAIVAAYGEDAGMNDERRSLA